MCSLEQRDNLFILTLTGPTPDDDHRLGPSTISSLLSALRRASSLSTPGSVLITTSSGKFFSNGFDLSHAQSTPDPHRSLQLMVQSFRPVVSALLSLPMPTIAAVNGHAAAAGLILALSHDYVVVNGARGFLYMSEVDIGLTLPDYFEAVLREKARVGGRKGLRELALWGTRLKGADAAEIGLVDEAVVAGGEEGVKKRAEEKAAELGKRKWDGRVYAELRKGLYKEVCDVLGLERRAVVAATAPTAPRSKI
ncbi:hypothetical protein MLD38_018095 [Melastoma candidum]|uniref:Uncharacterized protein n=1 Tax=Melastoma candidum TaxID=119954 RepID=A0ACB9QW93_9MYRT|nr:hypothetical protein MLD38_018095 [Melastoma candidum]